MPASFCHAQTANSYELNTGVLLPGQSYDVTLVSRARCGFHDHPRPDDERFHGTIASPR
jgi:hypothetical protein